MRAILIGYGEIGQAIKEVFGRVHDISIYDTKMCHTPSGEFDVMLISFPYGEEFVSWVKDYAELYQPKATIIFSTVAIGTTSRILNAVHSPIEGKHPRLASSLELMPWWVGGYNEVAHQFFVEADFEPTYLARPEFTEFIKLRSTARYGINIEFARYEKSVCDALGMDYEAVKQFDRDYNELYLDLGLPQFQRYILDPPEGRLGGHCLIPNAKMLDAQYPSVFLKEMLKHG